MHRPGGAAATSCRRRRPGRGSPMTSCSPTSWRCAGARAYAAAPAGAHRGRRARCAHARRRRPALHADRRRRRARSPRSSPISPSPSACCGCCRAMSAPARPWSRCSPCRRRGRGRAAGGADGADRDPRAPASRDHRAARRGRRHARRDPHRPRARPRARRRRCERLARGEIDLLVGTHALFQDEVEFRDLALAVVDEQHRFGVHQRLALGAQGRGRRRAGDDRDADPAHAGADRFRRHGRLRARREAAGPPADRHPHHAARPARRGDRRASAARSPTARRSTGSARWSRNPRASDLAAAEERFATLDAALRRTRRSRPRPHEGRREGRARWRASPPARRGSWSPPR